MNKSEVVTRMFKRGKDSKVLTVEILETPDNQVLVFVKYQPKIRQTYRITSFTSTQIPLQKNWPCITNPKTK